MTGYSPSGFEVCGGADVPGVRRSHLRACLTARHK
uniref:Uncharacterized protein n=1 Tax=Anguilla anguilla TaxID=7936 RepID=A0A0E9QVP2_ANGAN